ncbi:MAG: radical SAM protein [Promethearchaeota archaeon]
MELVYGPVMSWRFGRSLGIDPVPPPKRCTFDCIYCQLGPTRFPAKSVSRVQHKLPHADILQKNLETYLRQLSVEDLDVVTFSGSGEPTLNLELGSMVNIVRKHVPDLTVVLLTNGSKLRNRKVLRNLTEFDIVTIKFDAGDDATHLAINRPLASFRHAQLIKGIQELRKISDVTIALEVMLLKTDSGFTNIRGAAREALVQELIRVAPVVDLIQLYTPWRPPTNKHVMPINEPELQSFASTLTDTYESERIWVYGIHDARIKSATWKLHQSLQTDLLTLLQRRPCRLQDISQSFDVPAHSLISMISQLRRTHHIIAKEQANEVFYYAPLDN